MSRPKPQWRVPPHFPRTPTWLLFLERRDNGNDRSTKHEPRRLCPWSAAEARARNVLVASSGTSLATSHKPSSCNQACSKIGMLNHRPAGSGSGRARVNTTAKESQGTGCLISPPRHASTTMRLRGLAVVTPVTPSVLHAEQPSLVLNADCMERNGGISFALPVPELVTLPHILYLHHCAGPMASYTARYVGRPKPSMVKRAAPGSPKRPSSLYEDCRTSGHYEPTKWLTHFQLPRPSRSIRSSFALPQLDVVLGMSWSFAVRRPPPSLRLQWSERPGSARPGLLRILPRLWLFRMTVDSIRAVFGDVMVDSMMKRLFVDELPTVARGVGVRSLRSSSAPGGQVDSKISRCISWLVSRWYGDLGRVSVSAFPVTGVG